MLDILTTNPHFPEYSNGHSSFNQLNEFFNENSDHIPYGFLSDTLVVKGTHARRLESPMKDILVNQDLQHYFTLKGIQKDAYDY